MEQTGRGTRSHITGLASLEGVTSSYMTRVIRLAFLYSAVVASGAATVWSRASGGRAGEFVSSDKGRWRLTAGKGEVEY